MLAAAVRGKVRHRIFPGEVPSSKIRITRCASTWVLPEPALAETQADTRGLEAVCWARRVASGIRLAMGLILAGDIGCPFSHPRQMRIVAVTGHKFRIGLAGIALAGV